MTLGLDIVRRVYTRLRKPSQQALPYQTVLQTVGEIIARKKLDLALSTQNSLATTSDWFTPTSADFPLEEEGFDGILLPIRMERRSIDSDLETGVPVPIVNYEVLDTSTAGAVSFYGDPIRLVFRDTLDYISEQQYRIVYESDISDEEGNPALDSVIGLPAYFAGMVVLEACWELIDIVEDDTSEWMNFYKMVSNKWEAEITDRRDGWLRYVRMFKGRAQVPKRTFWGNRNEAARTRYFK